VAICHENAGTAEHFRDVARRFAKAGFVAIHLDLLSREGGTEAVPANERAAALTAPGKADLFVQDFRSAIAYLQAQESVRPESIAMTGYCFGGSVSWNVACREPNLKAVAPFYGPPAFPEELANIRAAALGVFGENDARVNASIPTVEAGLSKAGVPHRLVTYPGAMHAFFNDTRPNYHAEAATQAWSDTLEWFATHLGA
jgi:carboxymethylenebutenolidase